jgi:hypothetical protein
MIAPLFFPLRQRAAASIAACLAMIFVAGCQLPDLKPFATASASLAASINQGGDLAIAPLTQEAVVIDGKRIAPGAPTHPGTQLQVEWNARRKVAEAVLVYSASLAAISDASAKRKENAAALVDSVKTLAAAVPGADVGSTAAGNLAVSLVGTFVEVKAFHDLGAAVKSADPAIQVIAGKLHQDFLSLAPLFSTPQRTRISQVVPSLFDAEDYYATVKAKQATLRQALVKKPDDKDANAEIARVDALVAAVEPEVLAKRAELARLQAALADGQAFFAAAVKSIDAWAAAHADIAKALQEKRTPNLTLLATRAEELHGLIDALKTEKTNHAAP